MRPSRMESRHLGGASTIRRLPPHFAKSGGRDSVPPPSAPQPPVAVRGACLPPTDSPRHIRLAHRLDNSPDILQRILRTQRDADHALCLTYRKPNRFQHMRHLSVSRIARRTGGNGNPFHVKNMNKALPRPPPASKASSRHGRHRHNVSWLKTHQFPMSAFVRTNTIQKS